MRSFRGKVVILAFKLDIIHRRRWPSLPAHDALSAQTVHGSGPLVPASRGN